MNTNFESGKHESQREYTYYVPGRWFTYITQAVTAGITNIVTLAITVVVAILVILGGLTLAYFYLPTTVFNVIMLVVVADILLGFVVRVVLNRKN